MNKNTRVAPINNHMDVDSQIESLRRAVKDITERQEAILSYLGDMMGIELVRNVGNTKLRFADKDIR